MRRVKRWGVLCSLLLAGLAAGCGSAKNENVAQGMQLIEQLSYEQAMECFTAASANKEDMRLLLRGQGLACMGMTDYENAASYLEQALSLGGMRPQPLDFDINYYLATAYYRGGQTERAIAVYQAITDLAPQEKTAWYLKGTLELELGQQAQAQEDFDRAVQAAKEDYDLLIDIFCSCSKYGHTDIGAAYLQAVLEDDTLRISDYDKGRMSFYLGDYEQARLCLEKAKEQNGAAAASLLGQTYEKMGDYNYAASVYGTYLETKQPDAEIYNQLGLCKLKVGEYEAALAAFQAGLAIDGNTVMQSLRFNEIVAYEHLGNFEKAKLSMEQYLAQYPDDEKAQREYIFLKTR